MLRTQLPEDHSGALLFPVHVVATQREGKTPNGCFRSISWFVCFTPRSRRPFLSSTQPFYYPPGIASTQHLVWKMVLIGLKRRASGADFPRTPMEKKRSRIFRRASTNVQVQPALPSPPAQGVDHSHFSRLRRRGSHILTKLHMKSM